MHHKEMVTQFEKRENQILNYDNIAKGLFLFTIGLAKKTLMADPLTTHAQAFFDSLNSIRGGGGATT